MKKIKFLLLSLCALTIAAIAGGCGGLKDKLEQLKCEHEYGGAATSITKEATCYETGKAVYTCALCGKEKTEVIEKIGHSYESRTVIKAATCTSTGTLEYKCINDGCTAKKTEILDKAAHIVVEQSAKASTCTEQGHTAYSYCSVCNTPVVPKTPIAALGHSYVVQKAVAATCTTTGLTEGKECFVCGYKLVAQEIVPALGHMIVVDPAVEPTCGGGKTAGSHCGRCNETITAQQYIPGNGEHPSTENVAETPATCTTAGAAAGAVCTTCGDAVSGREEIAALGHDYDEEDGNCTRCGEHEHVEVVVEKVAATCTKEGHEGYTYCELCEEVLDGKDKVIAKLPHTEVILEAVAATCATEGKTEGKICGECDTVFTKQEVIPALGHNEVVTEGYPATCKNTGLSDSSECSRCGEVLQEQEVLPLAKHSYNDLMECKVCDYVYVTPGLKYSKSADGSYWIIEGIDPEEFDLDTQVIATPREMDGIPVREVKEYAFYDLWTRYDASNVSKIVLRGPNYEVSRARYLKVGAYAFALNNIESVVLEGYIGFEYKEIGGVKHYMQFGNLTELEEIVLKGAVSSYELAGDPLAEDDLGVFSNRLGGTEVTIRFFGSELPDISPTLFDSVREVTEIIAPKGIFPTSVTTSNWKNYYDLFVFNK